MSLVLDDSKPKITAKSLFGGGIFFSGDEFDIEVSDLDFCCLIEYYLENMDLKMSGNDPRKPLAENTKDPRLELVERIKKFKLVPGYNPGGVRIEIG